MIYSSREVIIRKLLFVSTHFLGPQMQCTLTVQDGLLAEYRSSAKIAVGKRILFFPNISRENKQKVTQSISTRELNVFLRSSTAVQSRNSSFSNSVSYILWLQHHFVACQNYFQEKEEYEVKCSTLTAL